MNCATGARRSRGERRWILYFWKGEANDWLDRTVNVPKVSSLTLEQWIDEFNRLKKVNDGMLAGNLPKKKAAGPKSKYQAA